MRAARPLSDALVRVLERPGAVDEGFALHSVAGDGSTVLVRFRWRLDPRTYAVRVPVRRPLSSPWTGAPVDEQEWAHDVAALLAEQLQTGLVAGAGRRRLGDGSTELTEPRVPPRVPHVWLSDVPRGHQRGGPVLLLPEGRTEHWGSTSHVPGAHLPEAGLDPTAGRAAHDAGTLVAWLQAWDEHEHGPCGQLVAVRTPRAGEVEVAVLALAPQAPPGTAADLLDLAAHEACCQGATLLVASPDSGLDPSGWPGWGPGGRRLVDEG